MAFVATQQPIRGTQSHSVGPFREEHGTYSCNATDTTGTITAKSLAEVDFVLISGLNLSSNSTYSGNAATIAFAVTGVASSNGTYILYGR